MGNSYYFHVNYKNGNHGEERMIADTKDEAIRMLEGRGDIENWTYLGSDEQ